MILFHLKVIVDGEKLLGHALSEYPLLSKKKILI